VVVLVAGRLLMLLPPAVAVLLRRLLLPPVLADRRLTVPLLLLPPLLLECQPAAVALSSVLAAGVPQGLVRPAELSGKLSSCGSLLPTRPLSG
jgi:hypothetical protein